MIEVTDQYQGRFRVAFADDGQPKQIQRWNHTNRGAYMAKGYWSIVWPARGYLQHLTPRLEAVIALARSTVEGGP
ncbi:MAG TPA: hypothetical protein VGR45_07355 [Stellaceae bacterium]|nr:hypothetical protein [Stellaceae bacterium]